MKQRKRIRYSGPASERFWKRVVIPDSVDGCWEWTGCVNEKGYGVFRTDESRNMLAHRYCWVSMFGPISGPRFALCHHCDNPKCVNPEHLFLGTLADNNEDMRQKGRSKTPTPKRGSASPNARLSDAAVAEILATKGEVTSRDLSDKYGVALCTVKRVRQGKTWKHINYDS